MPLVQDILVRPESVKSVFEWIKIWSINYFRWCIIPYVNNSAAKNTFSSHNDTWCSPVSENWFWWHALIGIF